MNIVINVLTRDSLRIAENLLISKQKPLTGLLFLLFDFFMFLLNLTPFAVFVELDLSCDEFLVFAAPVVDTFAGSASEFDQFIL